MTRILLGRALLMLIATTASAHRLDEYLQGTIIYVAKDQVSADLTLTPGVAVFPILIRSIDTNGDGVISESEQHAYADRVLGDMSLSIDGRRLTLHRRSLKFPTIAEMRDGSGEIHVEFYADLPRGGANRKLKLENRHQRKISVYLVNVLVPRDPDIRIVSQNRNYSQSFYELDFTQAGIHPDAASAFVAGVQEQLGIVLLLAGAVALFVVRKRALQNQTAHGRFARG